MTRTICWTPLWSECQPGVGLEHLQLGDRSADSVILAIDDDGDPLRITYRLAWDEAWRFREGTIERAGADGPQVLALRRDGHGRWATAEGPASGLDGCTDIDIWPTPFTNSFPVLREAFSIGERREFLMAWVSAPDLTVKPRAQAYTRVAERRYLFESLDGSGFKAEILYDESGFVLEYPGLFRRVHSAARCCAVLPSYPRGST